MTIEQKQQEIIDEFEVFEDWMDKYEYIIEIGKSIPIISKKNKTNERLIEGCQSKVWLHMELINGKISLTADSDAIITKGIIGLLIRVMNNEDAEVIAKNDLRFINEIGLQEHLSPTRANGLANMVKQIKLYAIKIITE